MWSANLKLAPDHLDLLIDRSLIYSAAENYWKTVDDLNRALFIDPNNADAPTAEAARHNLERLDIKAE